MQTPLDHPFRGPALRSFYAVAAVLERFIAVQPRDIGIQQIMDSVRLAEPSIRRACILLRQAGLITAAGSTRRWMLAAAPASITLADVWRITTAEGQARSKAGALDGSASSSKLDLLIVQALLDMEQNIAAHLANFYLDSPSRAQAGFRYVNYRCQRNRRFSALALAETGIAPCPPAVTGALIEAAARDSEQELEPV